MSDVQEEATLFSQKWGFWVRGKNPYQRNVTLTPKQSRMNDIGACAQINGEHIITVYPFKWSSTNLWHSLDVADVLRGLAKHNASVILLQHLPHPESFVFKFWKFLGITVTLENQFQNSCACISEAHAVPWDKLGEFARLKFSEEPPSFFELVLMRLQS